MSNKPTHGEATITTLEITKQSSAGGMEQAIMRLLASKGMPVRGNVFLRPDALNYEFERIDRHDTGSITFQWRAKSQGVQS